MSKRLIFTGSEGTARVKAYWNHEDQEYTVRLWCNGQERKGAEYFTDDKADALATSKAMLKQNDCGRSFGSCSCRRRK